MTFAELVPLVLKLSIAAQVFAIGLGTAPKELTYLLRHPGQLLRSLASMSLVMLIIAVLIVKLFDLPRPVEVTLVAMSLSPVPPLLPKKLVKAGGGHAYVMALLFSASVFAVAWIPLVGTILDRLFPASINIPPTAVAALAMQTVLGPVLVGTLVHMVLPKLAERIAAPIAAAAGILLIVAALLLLIKVGSAILAQLHDGTLIAIVAFILLGLLVGHVLGGPTPGDRSVLALATASRHPGIAIAIARLNFPDEKAVSVTILLYFIAGIIVSIPYVLWRKRALANGVDHASLAHPAH